jgi:nicotinic acid mononucleotide adenylyltransferase
MLLHFSDYFFLRESKEDTAVLSFGRMNPPTIGHQKLMKKLIEVGSKEGGVPTLFLSHSQDKKKNPLSYQEKLKFVRSNAPSGLRVMDSPARTIYEAIDTLVAQGFVNIIVICGSDRVEEFSKIEKYKEKMGFSSFKVVSSGERDADSDNIENSISASKMREYAKEEDFDNFAKGAGCSKSLIKDMYAAVRKGMGI